MGYVETLIAVADDCPVRKSEVPPAGKRKTVAHLQYELLSAHPGALTQEDVLFQTWLVRQEGVDRSEEALARLREEFFAKPQPCLRASPLPKRYGWGLLFDGQGRITLCPMESEQYKAIVEGAVPGIKVLKAFRSKRI